MEPGSPHHPRPNPSSGGGQPVPPPQQPTAQLPRVDPPAPPPADPPTGGPAGEGGGGGKKWTIISLVVILVAALGVGGFLLVKNKDDDSAGSKGEVFLTAAKDTGQDPFSNASFAADPDPTVATAATGPAPSGQSVAATATSGDQPGLYGGTNNLIVCDADKMATFLAANPDKARAWVAALNQDPNLRYSGGALTTANIPAYLATLTPIILVSDTRVTNHGFANGNPTELQSVLQKGTAVFVDAYGVPRVRCACGNPLSAPKATKSAPKYQGKTWTGFTLKKIGVVQPAKTPQTGFQVVNPAKPGAGFSLLPAGPFACVKTSGSCKTPSGVVKKSPTGIPGKPTGSSSSAASSSAPQSSSAPTSSSAPKTTAAPKTSPAKSSGTTSFPETTKSGTITALTSIKGNGSIYFLSFNGYSPNSTVTFTCNDGGGLKYGPFTTKTDASGSDNTKQAYCESGNSRDMTVTDRVGGRFKFNA